MGIYVNSTMDKAINFAMRITTNTIESIIEGVRGTTKIFSYTTKIIGQTINNKITMDKTLSGW